MPNITPNISPSANKTVQSNGPMQQNRDRSYPSPPATPADKQTTAMAKEAKSNEKKKLQADKLDAFTKSPHDHLWYYLSHGGQARPNEKSPARQSSGGEEA